MKRLLLLTLAAIGYAEEKPKVIEFPNGGRADASARRIEFEGVAVYPTRAPIELFACASGGKDHEAVISLQCLPQDLHYALLIFGLRDKREFPDQKGPAQPGDPAKPVGDRVLVWVEWEVDGRKERVRAEDLLSYGPPADGRTMPRCGWTFAGSEIWERVDPETQEKTGESIYMANRDRTLMSTWHDPMSVLDNPLKAGEDDRVFRPNFKILPPRGTKLTLAVEVPDEATLAELERIEKEADDEYEGKLKKKWEGLEETVPTEKGPEPVKDGK